MVLEEPPGVKPLAVLHTHVSPVGQNRRGFVFSDCERHAKRTLGSEASIPLDAILRPRNTPIWKLEAALKCRSCKKGRYAPLVHMIKLTQEREITPYPWVHPNDDDRR
jgi:hypothetical protein